MLSYENSPLAGCIYLGYPQSLNDTTTVRTTSAVLELYHSHLERSVKTIIKNRSQRRRNEVHTSDRRAP